MKRKYAFLTIGIIGIGFIAAAILWARTAPSPSAQSGWQSASVQDILSSRGSFQGTYTNKTYDFTVKYPQSFRVGEVPDGKNLSLVFQNPDKQQGVQVYIRPLEENLDLTASKLKNDVPDMKARNITATTVADEENALSFDAESEAFGESAEIWFVHEKTLYQASTYRGQEELLEKVVETWRFGE